MSETGIYIDVRASGEGVTPETAGYTSPWGVYYNPHTKMANVGLMMGSVDAIAYEKSMYILWDTIFGYMPRWNYDPAGKKVYDEQEVAFRPGSPRTGTQIERERLGRKPMLWAADVFEHVFKVLTDEKVVELFKWEPKKWIAERYFEFVMDEAMSIEWKVANELNSECQSRGGLGTPNGKYVWIGAERGGQRLTSRLNIDVASKGPPLKAWGGDVPMQPNSEAAYGLDIDRYGSVIMCGLVHAFERQQTYQQECAIRAANLLDVTKGQLSLNALLNANSRVAIHPRLSSTLEVRSESFPAVKGLVALYYAWDWITRQAQPTWGAPRCKVRYMVSDLTSATTLADEIKYFFRSVADYTEDPRTAPSGGQVFFPSNNLPTAKPMKLAFCNPAESEQDVMLCIPQILHSRKLELSTEPLTVTDRGVLGLPLEKQHTYMRYPVQFSDTRDFRDESDWLASYGRERIRRTIVDRMDYRPDLPSFAPSVLIRAMCLAWPLEQVNSFMVSNDPECPSSIVDFSDISFVLAGRSIMNTITGPQNRAIVPAT